MAFLGTNPRPFRDNALAGLQAAGASGLLMLAVWLQIALCLLALQLAWRGLRWAARSVGGKSYPTGSSRRSMQ